MARYSVYMMLQVEELPLFFSVEVQVNPLVLSVSVTVSVCGQNLLRLAVCIIRNLNPAER